jgi:methylenetetrahydrofolate dehydrogenase (NADP+)/methenyltetrahydrofolate cyclohydrolase
MIMSAKIMDGKYLSAKVKGEVRDAVAQMNEKPGLAVILVGDNPASRVYVTAKEKDCAECGITSVEYKLDASTTMEELLSLIDELNHRADIDGILCQLPLPKGLDEEQVLLAIDPEKDVDCFHPYNVGKMMVGDGVFLPCTPAGAMRLLEEAGVDPVGKHCVVVGRSNIVGKPMGILLLQKSGTVTYCHSRTPDLGAITRQADILVSAVGKVNLITADMVKEGAVVVDVAMNRNEAGKLCGDVDYAAVSEKASAITPVPGGCGPMTRAMLMVNTLSAAKLHGKS